MDLNSLNPQQRLAAETLNGPVLILAGAGSGKTRALTYRVANLIDQGVSPRSIMALTFTNKAAKEMKERITALVGDAAEIAWISTFHSSCARILRRDIEKIGYTRSFVIYDDDDQSSTLKEILKKLNIDDKYLPIREIKSKISDAKNKLMSADEWFQASVRDHRSQMLHDVFCEYENRLKSLNALDFDDLLLKTLELFVEHPPVLESYQQRFQYVMVDEYQDTNHAQYMLIKLLTSTSRNLCVVGDDDQSIYGWRGADVRNILDFEKDYPETKVIRLEQNYRSTTTILDAANQVIAHNIGRKDKALWTDRGEGDPICTYCAMDEREEGAWIALKINALKKRGGSYGDTAILYRTNAQSRVLEEMLMKSAIPYKVFGGQKFYDRKEVRDIIAYLRVIANPADDISLRRIINIPKRSIGESTVQELSSQAMNRNIPLYSILGDLPETLASRPRKCVTNFFLLLTTLSIEKEMMNLMEFVTNLVDKTGLLEQYTREDTEDARNRAENVREFLNAVSEFAQASPDAKLEDFLENVSLVSDLDSQEEARSYVTMMTLHSAKGLEFPNVFIAGMEEGLFPSARSLMDDEKIEEERRLCYVGITRAMRNLFLSRASQRFVYTQINHNSPSRFLEEIPERLIRDDSELKAKAFAGMPQMNSGRRGTVPRTPSVMPKRPAAMPGNPLNIPGVNRGFQASAARQNESSAMMKMYKKGDHVHHRLFGEGVVADIIGEGNSARIRIDFLAFGVKEFSLAIAPIVKVEDE